MPRLFVLLVPLLAILLAACDGDGDSSPTPPSEGTVTPTPQETTTAEPEPSPTATNDETPAGGETPTVEATPITVATIIPSPDEGVLLEKPCTFDAATSEVDCGENGLYAPDPPPADEDAECAVFLAQDQPLFVTCSLPQTVIYYDIPR